jgi:hypothetical protein
MASPRPRGKGFIVRWREGGAGTKERARRFRTLEEAQALKVTVEPTEYDKRFGKQPLPSWAFAVGEPEATEGPSRSLVRYITDMNAANAKLRPGTRALYERVRQAPLRGHGAGQDAGHLDHPGAHHRVVVRAAEDEWHAEELLPGPGQGAEPRGAGRGHPGQPPASRPPRSHGRSRDARRNTTRSRSSRSRRSRKRLERPSGTSTARLATDSRSS